MRIAGDSHQYSFRLCRIIGGLAVATPYGFDYPSVTTIIGDVIGKPAGAMSWWGFRIALQGISNALKHHDPTEILATHDAEELEAYLKQLGVNPNMSLEEAGGRGNSAHFVLEMLAGTFGEENREDIYIPERPTFREVAEAYAMDEALWRGTDYGNAVISWWDTEIQPHVDSGAIVNVLSEVPVWSHVYEFCGSFDLAIEWALEAGSLGLLGWEVIDLKTHRPARGFTKPGHGPAYISDVLQIRTYRQGFEECGLGQTIGQRAVIAREDGKYLEDSREVPFDLFVAVRRAYEMKQAFERGDV